MFCIFSYLNWEESYKSLLLKKFTSPIINSKDSVVGEKYFGFLSNKSKQLLSAVSEIMNNLIQVYLCYD